MKLPKKICVYVLSGEKPGGKTFSDERIFRCAELFSKAEGNTNLLCRAFPPFPAIERQEGRKPRFYRDIGLHFSVSHSGKYWACAVSEQEIGVDIQNQTVRYKQGIAKRFFHPAEYEFLEKNMFRDFFAVWTAKESYVKYTGQGIGRGFSSFSVVSHDRIADYVNGVKLRFLPLDLDYIFCLCAKEIGEINVILPETI